MDVIIALGSGVSWTVKSTGNLQCCPVHSANGCSRRRGPTSLILHGQFGQILCSQAIFADSTDVAEGVICTIIDIRTDTCGSSHQVVSIKKKIARSEHMIFFCRRNPHFSARESAIPGKTTTTCRIVGGMSNRVWAFSPLFERQRRPA